MRQSNFELLRIVSMMMVILWHFIVRCIIDIPDGALITEYQCTPEGMGGVILPCSFLCIAVNLFVLISGYWGIKLTIKGILKLYFLCLFYNLLAFSVTSYMDGFNIKHLVKCFFITRTDNWFFPAYFWLMFFAPICNSCLRNVNLKQMRAIVGLIVILNVFSGFVLGYNANSSGYSVIHLIMIYLIGGYIRKADINIKNNKCLICYVIFAVVNAFLCFVYVKITHGNGMYLYNYNNPIVIAQSVFVFLFFKNIHLESKIVNKFAMTVVAVLLIQDVVLRDLMIENLKSYLHEGYFEFLQYSAFWFISFFTAAYLIEQLRMPIANKMIDKIVGLLPKDIVSFKL